MSPLLGPQEGVEVLTGRLWLYETKMIRWDSDENVPVFSLAMRIMNPRTPLV